MTSRASLSATQIHPTAVVSKEAQLGDGVSVGPYAIIEAGAVVGAGTQILGHAVITQWATLGERCEVHYGALIGGEPQDLSFDGAPSGVVIGDRTVIREYATIHRATKPEGRTEVGADCFIMGAAHVAHDCKLGDRVIVCNSALIAGHSEVHDRAFISGNTVIHQFSRVGKVVMLSGTSGVGKDVGPYLTVIDRSDIGGFNAVGMRRAGLGRDARVRVREAYRRLFSEATLEAGLAGVRELGPENEEIREILDFYAASKRGFSRPPAGSKLAEA